MSGTAISVSGFFPSSNVVAVGLPANFNILDELERADSIRLAMAFCHMTGWNRLAPGILKSKGEVHLLTGLDFSQTEPALLHVWNRLSVDRRFRPRLVTAKPGIFHPKVLIVSSANKVFALVGSGNLSEGGLRTNIECFLYTAEPTQAMSLTKWFDGVFQSAQEFGDAEIKAYEPKYRKAKQLLTKIRSEQNTLEASLIERNRAFLSKWQQAVDQAKQEFQKSEFGYGWTKRKQSVEKMKQFLHYPTFDFSAEEWSKFYAVLELGHLIPIYRDRLFQREKRLKEVLRFLIDETIPIDRRLHAILDGKGGHRIVGLRMNTVSKVLALHDGRKWPVLNAPVDTTLQFFGYKSPRGIGLAGRYLTFANLMQDFMKECNAPDVYALDYFFYWFAERMKPVGKNASEEDLYLSKEQARTILRKGMIRAGIPTRSTTARCMFEPTKTKRGETKCKFGPTPLWDHRLKLTGGKVLKTGFLEWVQRLVESGHKFQAAGQAAH